MPYTPPPRSAVNFSAPGVAYTAPERSAVDFTSYLDGGFSGTGLGTYQAAGAAEATYELPNSRHATGAGMYRPTGVGYDVPPTANGSGRYAVSGDAYGGRGSVSDGTGRYSPSGIALGLRGVSGSATVVYRVSGSATGSRGSRAEGGGAYAASGGAAGSTYAGVVGIASGSITPTGVACGWFGDHLPVSENTIFVRQRRGVIHVLS